MDIRVEVPDVQLRASRDLIRRLAYTEIASEEMEKTKEHIIASVRGGHQDVNAASLRGYSPSYLKAIRRGQVIGHDGTVKTSLQTDLTISHALLDSITVTPVRNGAECSFQGSHPLGRPSKGKRKSGGGGGGSVPNETLAGWMYGLGFVGWFQFGRKRVDEIVLRFADQLVDLLFD